MKEEAEGEAEENWCLRRENRECSLAGLYAFRVISMSPSESEDREPGIVHHSTNAWLTSMGTIAEKVMHVARELRESRFTFSPDFEAWVHAEKPMVASIALQLAWTRKHPETCGPLAWLQGSRFKRPSFEL
jgi:hypothetical protein